MKAILLCAGFATRMYPLTKNFPKPLLEVAGKPVLDYLMDQLLDLSGLQEIVVVTNAKFYVHFEAWAGDWQPRLDSLGLRLILLNDGTSCNETRLGAVADLAFALRETGNSAPALVAAGDNILRFSLRPLWENFVRADKSWVVALRETNPRALRSTGVLEIDARGQILWLHEKPENPPTQWISPALYFLQPGALQHVHAYLGRPDAADAPGHFIAYLVALERVYAAKVPGGRRFDIGSMTSFRKANQVLSREPVILSQTVGLPQGH